MAPVLGRRQLCDMPWVPFCRSEVLVNVNFAEDDLDLMVRKPQSFPASAQKQLQPHTGAILPRSVVSGIRSFSRRTCHRFHWDARASMHQLNVLKSHEQGLEKLTCCYDAARFLRSRNLHRIWLGSSPDVLQAYGGRLSSSPQTHTSKCSRSSTSTHAESTCLDSWVLLPTATRRFLAAQAEPLANLHGRE